MNRYLRHIFLLSVCCVLFISSIHAQLVFQDKATKKWGYKNQEGEIVCPAEYSEIKIISKEFVFAGKTGAHFGLIDQKTGRELTPLIYGGMEMFDDDKVIAFVYKPGDVLHSYCVVLNKKGKEISSHYWIIGKCIDGFAVVGLENEKDEQHFGFINSKCKVTMPIVYELVFPYSDDMARVASGSGNNKKYGYVNKDGELLIPCIYNEADDFKNGYANVDMNDTVKTIDRTGKVVLNLGKRLK